MSTSMGASKPTGIPKKDYQDIQQVKSQEDFQYQVNQRIQNIQFAIDEINQTLAKSIAQYGVFRVDCNNQITNILDQVVSSMKEFRQILGNMKSDVSNLETWIKQTRSDLTGYVEVSVFNEKISLLQDEISSIRLEKERTRNDLNGLCERLKSDFDARLKAMKQEILDIPSGIPDLKQALDQKLELLELNSQNYVLRSSNNEKQIMLVERKIENIYQLIKRLEIANQETK